MAVVGEAGGLNAGGSTRSITWTRSIIRLEAASHFRGLNVMDNNYRALKSWAALAAALIPLLAACGGPNANIVSVDNLLAWRTPSTNDLGSLRGMTTSKPGPLGLVISGCAEGAVVERVVIGSLAWQAGIRVGDVIVAVNNRLLLGLGLPRIVQLLSERTGSEMELTLRRPGQRELLKLRAKRALPAPEAIP